MLFSCHFISLSKHLWLLPVYIPYQKKFSIQNKAPTKYFSKVFFLREKVLSRRTLTEHFFKEEKL